MSYKRLFSRSLGAAPERLHFAAHCDHLWPDASFEGQQAARRVGHSANSATGEVWSDARANITAELKLPSPDTIVFAPNTDELLVGILSVVGGKRPRVLASDNSFNGFLSLPAKWEEAGAIALETVAMDDPGFADALIARAGSGDFDLILVSHVMLGSGRVFNRLEELAALARPDGPWVVIDGDHAFMAIDSDLSETADRVFYLASGSRYAMAGAGACFLHAPPGYSARPIGGTAFDPSGLHRFNAVRAMLKREGLTTASVNAHVHLVLMSLAAELDETGLGTARLLNPGILQPRARFLALESPRARAWHDALAGAGVITDLSGDVLRIGVGLYHDEDDITQLCDIAARF